MSNVIFREMVHLLKNAFPDINIPDSFYKTKKLIRAMGYDYNKIDVCQNNCVLFWKQDEKLDACKVCNEPKWKPSKASSLKKRKKSIRKNSEAFFTNSKAPKALCGGEHHKGHEVSCRGAS